MGIAGDRNRSRGAFPDRNSLAARMLPDLPVSGAWTNGIPLHTWGLMLTNSGVMTAATAMKVGQAAGTHFLRGKHRHRVVIGKDTRLSGYMIENALVAGFTSVGMDVVLTGPLPTPAIALLPRHLVSLSSNHKNREIRLLRQRLLLILQ